MKQSVGERAFDLANTVFLTFMIVITIYPIYYVLNASLSDSNRLLSHQGVLLYPLGFSLAAYKIVFQNPNIWTGLWNTVIIVVFGTLINMFFSILGAYGLSRRSVYWNSHLMLLILFTMFFSGGLIPTFLIVNNSYHMGNTLWALMIPTAINTWNLIIMRTSFQEVPEALLESARIDGANDWTIIWRVMIPLTLPLLMVMLLFYGVQNWNAWFNAVIYLRDRALYPLQLIVREILIQNSTDAMVSNTDNSDKEAIAESIKYATIIVSTVPILIVYPFLQKYFMKGVMVGALKE